MSNSNDIQDFMERGYSEATARRLAAAGFTAMDDSEAIEDYLEEGEDLESRGFFFGTDDPFENDRLERQAAQDDLYERWLNEY